MTGEDPGQVGVSGREVGGGERQRPVVEGDVSGIDIRRDGHAATVAGVASALGDPSQGR